MVSDAEALTRLLVATALGLIVGVERELAGRPAGLRTHALVALASCGFTVVSALAFPGNDPSRIASGVVAGLGFIGGGMIMREEGRGVLGLTTAAGIWTVGAVGMAIGAGLYLVGTVIAVVAALILASEHAFQVDERLSRWRRRGDDPDGPHGPYGKR